MKINILVLLIFVFFLNPVTGKNLIQNFDRPSYYSVLASGKTEVINDELKLLNTTILSEKEAYEGTLLMRKAGLVKIPAEKLKFFKAGRIKLEKAILNDSDNGEYRFLRLIIQEHAPKIVKYNADLEADKKLIKASFKTLPHSVQQAIIDYSKNSTILHPEDF